jgi:hypothetical protein
MPNLPSQNLASGAQGQETNAGGLLPKEHGAIKERNGEPGSQRHGWRSVCLQRLRALMMRVYSGIQLETSVAPVSHSAALDQS